MSDFRTKPDKKGWRKLGQKHYRHEQTENEVKYDCNRWLWIVTGGPYSGYGWRSLWIAMRYAIKETEYKEEETTVPSPQ